MKLLIILFFSIFVSHVQSNVVRGKRYPGKPVNIMRVLDENGTKSFFNEYQIIDDILQHPLVENRKVVVLSIIGAYRKGKSFFMDYCLRYMYATFRSVKSEEKIGSWMGDPNEALQGFTWRAGRKADTKGIIFWDDVFLYDSPEGEKIAIILMDTQGLFEVGSTHEENARIFGLSTLISSVQILNIRGEIQEDQIEYLDMATGLTKIVTQKLNTTNNKWKPFQKLLLLNRDWTDESEGFGYEGGKVYLDEFLNNISPNTNAYGVRKNIKKSFDSIECYLLNFPGTEVTKRDFNGGFGKLERDFVENLNILIESLLSPEALTKKLIFGSFVTGNEFREYVLTFFDAFRNASLPNIENIVKMTIRNQMKAIAAEQLKIYNSLMASDNIPYDSTNYEELITEKHKSVKFKALENYKNAKKVPDDDVELKYYIILSDDIDQAFKDWKLITMRQYQNYLVFKAQLDTLNLEKEQYQARMNKANEKLTKQQKEQAVAMEKFKRDRRREQDKQQLLQKQINDLKLSQQEKNERLDEQRTHYENRLNEAQKQFQNQQAVAHPSPRHSRIPAATHGHYLPMTDTLFHPFSQASIFGYPRPPKFRWHQKPKIQFRSGSFKTKQK